MNMKQVRKPRFTWRLAGLMAGLVFISMAKQVSSQSNNRNSTLIRSYCSLYQGTNSKYFLSNLNETLSSLRRQLSVNRERYALARSLRNGEPVWGLALCRNYVSHANCVACYDYAVAQLKVCGLGNGAHVFYNDCDVRYENKDFYSEANVRAGIVICGNTTSPQPEFRKSAERLLSDLRKATPRTSNYYAASTRRIAGGNDTVYAIAQCNLNLTQSVCQECLNSRYGSLDDCLPSTVGRAIDNGCFMRYSRTPFFGQNQTTDISTLLGDGNSSKKRSIIGGVVGGICFLLLVFAFFLWRLRSKKTSRRHGDKSTGSTELLQGPVKYNYDDLKLATNDFSDDCKLGGGIFGEVYKGTLKDGDTVAIKKTVMATTRGKIHINNELKIICNVHHRHLIRLLGYCSKGPLLFLVHEYMENGSLDQFLYGDKSRNLSWKQRFEIIFGTARGLAYLHEQYHVTIIHRDIKTSNILLDNEYQPKIADFGLIRLLPEDKTHLSTELGGSLDSGYVAPEYALNGQLSEKVDTYSFGIVVLEIISGKRCNNVKDSELGTQSLLDHAWNQYECGTHLNLVDDRLDPSEYAEEDVKKIIEIALMCTQSPVSARPAMSEVVSLLSDKSLDEMPHVRSTFQDNDVRIQVDTSRPISSDATASTFQVSGR